MLATWALGLLRLSLPTIHHRRAVPDSAFRYHACVQQLLRDRRMQFLSVGRCAESRDVAPARARAGARAGSERSRCPRALATLAVTYLLEEGYS